MRLVPSTVAAVSLPVACGLSHSTVTSEATWGDGGWEGATWGSWHRRGLRVVRSKGVATVRCPSAKCLIPGTVLLWLCFFTSLHGCGPNVERPVARDQQAASTLVRDTMRIHFERSGGFTGLTLVTTVESDTLSQQEEQHLRQLLDEAGFFDLPGLLQDTTSAVDQFRYTVTVETPGRRHTVEVTDGAVPPPLRPLLQWLARAARRRT